LWCRAACFRVPVEPFSFVTTVVLVSPGATVFVVVDIGSCACIDTEPTISNAAMALVLFIFFIEPLVIERKKAARREHPNTQFSALRMIQV
jgi:hypothetical protein